MADEDIVAAREAYARELAAGSDDLTVEELLSGEYDEDLDRGARRMANMLEGLTADILALIEKEQRC